MKKNSTGALTKTMVSGSQDAGDNKPLGGRYHVIEKLGVGGFGQTFLARDMHLPGHPQCVVKKLKPQVSDDDEEGLQTARRLFQTEAQVLYRLGNHEQIPRLLAHFEENHEFYLAQEYIQGQPLSKEIDSHLTWSQEKVLSLLQDILQVLTFVHQQHVIHRDIKPANLIRRAADGRIVLIDFGAVKQVRCESLNPETGLTNVTISIGTKGYMPNEQLAGKPRYSSDVYAVGIIGIQLLTGIHPKHIKEDSDTGELNWRKYAKQISPEFGEILDKMVRYDFRDRYATAAETLLAFQSLPAPLLESASPPQPLTPECELPPLVDPQAPTDQESQNLAADSAETQAWEATPTESTLIEVEESNSESSSSSSQTQDTGRTQTSQPTPGRTDATVSLSQPQDFEPTATVSTTSRSRGFRQWLMQPWTIATIAIAFSSMVTVTLILLPSQLNHQSQIEDVPPESPSPTPSPSPSPSPTPEPTAESLLAEAEDLRQAGEYEKAILVYNQAIELQSDLAPAYWGRCYSLNQLGQPEQALVACNDALAYQSNYADALVSKADALWQQNQIIDALRHYERVTRYYPNFARGWIRYGIALQGVGRSAEAVQALDKAIELDRNSADAWATRGEALMALGRTTEAIPSLDKALQLEPDHEKAADLREKARERLGR
ncbi:protein kinase domain-containing protein [Coleofasciculus sp.]|uniref:protein kinase domain-containing protein n=1 Tax=Coleofasciculus sp. TaxID=3100458 RepID=UPI003A3A7010